MKTGGPRPFPLNLPELLLCLVRMNAEDLFTLPTDFPFADFFSGDDQPWIWVSRIKEALSSASFEPNANLNDALPSGVVI